MSISANTMTDLDVQKAQEGPTWCFPAVKSDTNYLVDPDGPGDVDKAIVSAAITLDREDEAVKVEFWNKRTAIIPAGTLKAGVRYKLHIVKVFSTGTGSNVKVLIWQGESVRDLQPTSY